MPLTNYQALVAAGGGWNLSTAFLSAKAKAQARDSKGRFIKMGGTVRWKDISGKWRWGWAVGNDGKDISVQENGKSAVAKIKPKQLEVVKALIPSNKDEAAKLKEAQDWAQKIAQGGGKTKSAPKKKVNAAEAKASLNEELDEQGTGYTADDSYIQDMLEHELNGPGDYITIKPPSGSEISMSKQAAKAILGLDDDDDGPKATIPDAPPTVNISADDMSPIDDGDDEPALFVDTTGFKKVGGQAGSNAGGVYEGPDGTRYYVKKAQTEQHAANEVLAAQLYKEAGIAIPEIYLTEFPDGGGPAIASKMVDGLTPMFPGGKVNAQGLKKAQAGFAMDAWLANWDSVGLVYDNLMKDANGDPVRVDPGGALLYRAMGSPKGGLFGDKVGETDTLRNASMNAQAAKVFGPMLDGDIAQAVADTVNKVDLDKAFALIDELPFSSDQIKTDLKAKLKARKEDLNKKFNVPAAPEAAPSAPKKLTKEEISAKFGPQSGDVNPDGSVVTMAMALKVGDKVKLNDGTVAKLIAKGTSSGGLPFEGVSGPKAGEKFSHKYYKANKYNVLPKDAAPEPKPAPEASPEQAIQDYQYNGGNWNEALRKSGGKIDDPKIAAVDALIEQSTFETPDNKLYRGLDEYKPGALDSFREQLKPGAVITDFGFMSTSKDPVVAEEIAGDEGILLEIDATGTSKGYDFGNAEMAQDEVLLPRNTSLEVISVDEDENGRTVVQARWVPTPVSPTPAEVPPEAEKAPAADAPKVAPQVTNGDFSDEEYEALDEYAGDNHGPINDYLRNGLAHGMAKEDIEYFSDKISGAIDESTVTSPGTVYRGIADEQFDDYVVGSVLHDKGFASTSTNLEKAKQFSKFGSTPGSVFEIEVPKGAHAIDIGKMGIGGYNEKEILLQKDSDFEITDVTTLADGSKYFKARLLKGAPGGGKPGKQQEGFGDDSGGAGEGTPGAPDLDSGPGDGDTSAPEEVASPAFVSFAKAQLNEELVDELGEDTEYSADHQVIQDLIKQQLAKYPDSGTITVTPPGGGGIPLTKAMAKAIVGQNDAPAQPSAPGDGDTSAPGGKYDLDAIDDAPLATGGEHSLDGSDIQMLAGIKKGDIFYPAHGKGKMAKRWVVAGSDYDPATKSVPVKEIKEDGSLGDDESYTWGQPNQPAEIYKLADPKSVSPSGASEEASSPTKFKNAPTVMVTEAAIEPETHAYKFYTENGYIEINAFLREGKTTIEHDSKFLGDRVHWMDSLMKRAVTLNSSTVYRGADNKGKWLPDGPMAPGTIVEDKAFLSTSVDLDTAKIFHKQPDKGDAVLFEIELPEGTKALDLDALGLNTLGEGEILLPRNSKLSVLTDQVQPNGVRYVKASLVLDAPEDADLDAAPEMADTSGIPLTPTLHANKDWGTDPATWPGDPYAPKPEGEIQTVKGSDLKAGDVFLDSNGNVVGTLTSPQKVAGATVYTVNTPTLSQINFFFDPEADYTVANHGAEQPEITLTPGANLKLGDKLAMPDGTVYGTLTGTNDKGHLTYEDNNGDTKAAIPYGNYWVIPGDAPAAAANPALGMNAKALRSKIDELQAAADPLVKYITDMNYNLNKPNASGVKPFESMQLNQAHKKLSELNNEAKPYSEMLWDLIHEPDEPLADPDANRWDSPGILSFNKVGNLPQETWDKYRDMYVVNDPATTAHNAGLRSGNPSTSDKQWAGKVDKLIGQYQAKDDAVVYRGAAFAPEFIAGLEPGSVLEDKAFMSTGTSDDAHYYAKTRASYMPGSRIAIFKIQMHGGQTAADVGYDEFVLPRNSKLVIKEMTDGSFGEGDKATPVTYITAELAPNGDLSKVKAHNNTDATPDDAPSAQEAVPGDWVTFPGFSALSYKFGGHYANGSPKLTTAAGHQLYFPNGKTHEDYEIVDADTGAPKKIPAKATQGEDNDGKPGPAAGEDSGGDVPGGADGGVPGANDGLGDSAGQGDQEEGPAYPAVVDEHTFTTAPNTPAVAKHAQLTSPEHKSLNSYTGTGSSAMNGYLRGVSGYDKPSPSVLGRIKNLAAAIRKQTLKADTVLYRGLKNKGWLPDEPLEPGDQFQDDGFLSTSSSLSTAKSFASWNSSGSNLGGKTPTVIELHMPKGARALDVTATQVPVKHNEKEFILPKGAVWEVISDQKDTKGRRVVKANLVLSDNTHADADIIKANDTGGQDFLEGDGPSEYDAPADPPKSPPGGPSAAPTGDGDLPHPSAKIGVKVTSKKDGYTGTVVKVNPKSGYSLVMSPDGSKKLWRKWDTLQVEEEATPAPATTNGSPDTSIVSDNFKENLDYHTGYGDEPVLEAFDAIKSGNATTNDWIEVAEFVDDNYTPNDTDSGAGFALHETFIDLTVAYGVDSKALSDAIKAKNAPDDDTDDYADGAMPEHETAAIHLMETLGTNHLDMFGDIDSKDDVETKKAWLLDAIEGLSDADIKLSGPELDAFKALADALGVPMPSNEKTTPDGPTITADKLTPGDKIWYNGQVAEIHSMATSYPSNNVIALLKLNDGKMKSVVFTPDQPVTASDVKSLMELPPDVAHMGSIKVGDKVKANPHAPVLTVTSVQDATDYGPGWKTIGFTSTGGAKDALTFPPDKTFIVTEKAPDAPESPASDNSGPEPMLVATEELSVGDWVENEFGDLVQITFISPTYGGKINVVYEDTDGDEVSNNVDPDAEWSAVAKDDMPGNAPAAEPDTSVDPESAAALEVGDKIEDSDGDKGAITKIEPLPSGLLKIYYKLDEYGSAEFNHTVEPEDIGSFTKLASAPTPAPAAPGPVAVGQPISPKDLKPGMVFGPPYGGKYTVNSVTPLPDGKVSLNLTYHGNNEVLPSHTVPGDMSGWELKELPPAAPSSPKVGDEITVDKMKPGMVITHPSGDSYKIDSIGDKPHGNGDIPMPVTKVDTGEKFPSYAITPSYNKFTLAALPDDDGIKDEDLADWEKELLGISTAKYVAPGTLKKGDVVELDAPGYGGPQKVTVKEVVDSAHVDGAKFVTYTDSSGLHSGAHVSADGTLPTDMPDWVKPASIKSVGDDGETPQSIPSSQLEPGDILWTSDGTAPLAKLIKKTSGNHWDIEELGQYGPWEGKTTWQAYSSSYKVVKGKGAPVSDAAPAAAPVKMPASNLAPGDVVWDAAGTKPMYTIVGKQSGSDNFTTWDIEPVPGSSYGGPVTFGHSSPLQIQKGKPDAGPVFPPLDTKPVSAKGTDLAPGDIIWNGLGSHPLGKILSKKKEFGSHTTWNIEGIGPWAGNKDFAAFHDDTYQVAKGGNTASKPEPVSGPKIGDALQPKDMKPGMVIGNGADSYKINAISKASGASWNVDLTNTKTGKNYPNHEFFGTLHGWTLKSLGDGPESVSTPSAPEVPNGTLVHGSTHVFQDNKGKYVINKHGHVLREGDNITTNKGETGKISKFELTAKYAKVKMSDGKTKARQIDTLLPVSAGGGITPQPAPAPAAAKKVEDLKVGDKVMVDGKPAKITYSQPSAMNSSKWFIDATLEDGSDYKSGHFLKGDTTTFAAPGSAPAAAPQATPSTPASSSVTPTPGFVPASQLKVGDKVLAGGKVSTVTKSEMSSGGQWHVVAKADNGDGSTNEVIDPNDTATFSKKVVSPDAITKTDEESLKTALSTGVSPDGTWPAGTTFTSTGSKQTPQFKPGDIVGKNHQVVEWSKDSVVVPNKQDVKFVGSDQPMTGSKNNPWETWEKDAPPIPPNEAPAKKLATNLKKNDYVMVDGKMLTVESVTAADDDDEDFGETGHTKVKFVGKAGWHDYDENTLLDYYGNTKLEDFTPKNDSVGTAGLLPGAIGSSPPADWKPGDVVGDSSASKLTVEKVTPGEGGTTKVKFVGIGMEYTLPNDTPWTQWPATDGKPLPKDTPALEDTPDLDAPPAPEPDVTPEPEAPPADPAQPYLFTSPNGTSIEVPVGHTVYPGYYDESEVYMTDGLGNWWSKTGDGPLKTGGVTSYKLSATLAKEPLFEHPGAINIEPDIAGVYDADTKAALVADIDKFVNSDNYYSYKDMFAALKGLLDDPSGSTLDEAAWYKVTSALTSPYLINVPDTDPNWKNLKLETLKLQKKLTGTYGGEWYQSHTGKQYHYDANQRKALSSLGLSDATVAFVTTKAVAPNSNKSAAAEIYAAVSDPDRAKIIDAIYGTGTAKGIINLTRGNAFKPALSGSASPYSTPLPAIPSAPGKSGTIKLGDTVIAGDGQGGIASLIMPDGRVRVRRPDGTSFTRKGTQFSVTVASPSVPGQAPAPSAPYIAKPRPPFEKPDWSKTLKGTGTAQKALDEVHKSNWAANHGYSFAADHDQIEDLDVHVSRILDQHGQELLELKFKVTPKHGKDLTKRYGADPSWTQTGLKIEERDMSDGNQLAKLQGTYKISANKTEGWTYSSTTSDGAKVLLHQVAKPGQGPYAVHNMMQIRLPANATPEQIAKAMYDAGIDSPGPASETALKRFGENRLMSIFASQTNANTETLGQKREDLLAGIKSQWGITWEDLQVHHGANGRIEVLVPQNVADKMASKTGVNVFHHNVSGGDQRFVEIATNPHQALLSTTTRWSEGIPKSGMSSSQDVNTGGADYVFFSPRSSASGHGLHYDAKRMFRRTDFYANNNDKFGKRLTNVDVLSQIYHGAYETMFKHRAGLDDAMGYVTNDRDNVIKKIKAKGITHIGGRTVEQFVVSSASQFTPPDPLVVESVSVGGPVL